VVLDLLDASRRSENYAPELFLLGGPPLAMPPVQAEIIEYSGHYNEPLTLLRTAGLFRKFLLYRQPSLIHSHGWDAAMIAAMARLNIAIPHLIHMHTTDAWLESKQVKHYLRRSMTRWMLNQPLTSVVAVSEAVRRHWVCTVGLPSESVFVVRNGVDTQRFHPAGTHGRSNATPTIGVAVRLQANKGLEDLLEALSLLATDHVYPKLLVAGEGNLRGALESRVAQLRLRTQVTFLGFCSDIAAFYRRIDIGVLPSRSEGLPLTVLEAMASGVPVVATDVGGTREVLRHGMEGFLVPAREPAALADALRRLVHDLAGRQRMGRNARRRVEESFSSARVHTQVSALYRELVKRSVRGQSTKKAR